MNNFGGIFYPKTKELFIVSASIRKVDLATYYVREYGAPQIFFEPLSIGMVGGANERFQNLSLTSARPARN